MPQVTFSFLAFMTLIEEIHIFFDVQFSNFMNPLNISENVSILWSKAQE